MKLIRNLANISPGQQQCILTIGNFDGVHRGHQQVLQRLLEQANHYQRPAVLMTFEPTPQEYFAKGASPAILTRLREKLLQLAPFKLAAVVCLRFNRALAELSAEQFVSQILVQHLQVKCIIIGEDFRFGHQRMGTVALLQDMAKQYGFEVLTVPAAQLSHQRVSSTLIRQALAQGDFSFAEAMLGRPYTMLGKVVKGDQRGRLLGFPTANLRLQRRQSPLQGVYAVKVHGLGDKPLLGAANIGKRPTLDGMQEWLEVHILDFQQAIYGYCLEIEFIGKIRDEQRFASKELLVEQLAQDIKQARILLSENAHARL